jgi:hypothetical protein
VVKSKRRVVAIVTAPLAAASFPLNQQQPSFASALLLRDVILMLVIRPGVLAPARAETSLPAGQFHRTDEASPFHKTSKVGLQAYHIRFG